MLAARIWIPELLCALVQFVRLLAVAAVIATLACPPVWGVRFPDLVDRSNRQVESWDQLESAGAQDHAGRPVRSASRLVARRAVTPQTLLLRHQPVAR